MTADEILTDLSARQVELWMEGNRLRFRAPAGVLTDELRRELGASKAEIIARLKAGAQTPEATFGLSFTQHAMYFLHRATPTSAAYNVGSAMRVRSAVSVEALGRSLQALVDRHPSLRTTFADGPAEPVQIVHRWREVTLDVIDASGYSDDCLLEAVEQRYGEPFDLARGPVFRPSLVTRSESDHVLLLTMHHIVADGWSLWVMLDELTQLYRADLAGGKAALGRPNATYAEFVRRQRDMLATAHGEELRTYWRTQLGNNPEPLDLRCEGVPRKAGERAASTVAVELTGAVVSDVRELARRQGTTLFCVLMAAYQVLLCRYSGRTDILVGTPTSGRGSAELHPVVGNFVNSVVVRGNLAGNPSFSTFLAALRQTVVDAVSHEEYPFACVVQDAGIARDSNRQPVFQTMFMLQAPRRSTDLAGLFAPAGATSADAGGLIVEPYLFAQQEGQLDLTLEVIDFGPTLMANFKYGTALFSRPAIERMGAHFEALLLAIAEDPDRRISDLAMLTDPERTEILSRWNDTAAAYRSDLGLEGLFEREAAAAPGRVAVVQDDRTLTYGELNARANRIARRLQALGVGPDVLVGVGLPRTPDLIATLLAVAKAGGAYVPLDPAFPAQRLAWMLDDARPAVLVTERGLAARWPAGAAHVLCLDDPAEQIAEQRHDNLPTRSQSASLAYVIFTSGSTGRPKGVQIPRSAVVNFLTSMQQAPGLTPDDRLLAVTTLSFDIAVLELFLPLVTGAAIVLATGEDSTDAGRLTSLLDNHGVTVMQATPVTWRMLVEAGWRGNRQLRALCGGEALPPDLAEALVARTREVWNLYGPTETTVWSTLAAVALDRPVSIGRPIANTQIYVLGVDRELLPAGVAGELWIGGDGVACGYHERPDLTAERFVPNPFLAGGRMYRTGDLARWRDDGSLQHLGRIDNQVKIRGFRIELGDIEASLLSLPEVREAAVVVHTSGSGDRRLVAFVVPRGAFSAETVTAGLRQQLPDYLVPSTVLPIDELPLTPNGKIDRGALQSTAVEAHGRTREVVPPRSDSEIALAAIWSEVLAVDSVSIHDNFFELGGHSLLATQVVSRVRSRRGVELPIRLLFDAPTLERLAIELDRMAHASPAVAGTTESQTDGDECADLSDAEVEMALQALLAQR